MQLIKPKRKMHKIIDKDSYQNVLSTYNIIYNNCVILEAYMNDQAIYRYNAYNREHPEGRFVNSIRGFLGFCFNYSKYWYVYKI
jgi:hypothetical protein